MGAGQNLTAKLHKTSAHGQNIIPRNLEANWRISARSFSKTPDNKIIGIAELMLIEEEELLISPVFIEDPNANEVTIFAG
jgi:hypothetical protein